MSEQIAEKNYYLDAEGNMVQEGDEAAATLLVGKGSEISKDMAEKYDFGKQVAQPEAADAADEAKSETPKANKSAAPTKNKGAK